MDKKTTPGTLPNSGRVCVCVCVCAISNMRWDFLDTLIVVGGAIKQLSSPFSILTFRQNFLNELYLYIYK